jgi:anaerobic C4-dicarboxylate transporter DcuA
MIWLSLVIVLAFIVIGARMGGIGIGFAGGAGIIILTLILGLQAGTIPVDVILIIMTVIGSIASMQLAGGLDHLVYLSEKLLRANPKRITFIAPLVTYFLTLFAGTGHTAYAALPVIVEVSKEGGIRPSRPLSISVVASQIAITASPISAAVVIFASYLEPLGVSYIDVLLVAIPSTMIGCGIGAFVANLLGKPLHEDPIYQERLEKGLIKQKTSELKPGGRSAKLSLIVFLFTILSVVIYAIATSDQVGLISDPTLSLSQAIMAFMLLCALGISLVSKLDISKITNASTFKSGMSAAVCVLGVAWLGDTFISNYLEEIKTVSGEMLQSYPWSFAVILFFASMLLYSQAATTTALVPSAIALGVTPVSLVASFVAVSALFVLPTYPTLLAAVEMDDTGSTRIGKFVVDHPFVIPGITTIAASIIAGLIIGQFIL